MKKSCIWQNHKLNLKFQRNSLRPTFFDFDINLIEQGANAEKQISKKDPEKIFKTAVRNTLLHHRRKSMENFEEVKKSHRIYVKGGLEELIKLTSEKKRKQFQMRAIRTSTGFKSLRTHLLSNQVDKLQDIKSLFRHSSQLALKQIKPRYQAKHKIYPLTMRQSLIQKS